MYRSSVSAGANGSGTLSVEGGLSVTVSAGKQAGLELTAGPELTAKLSAGSGRTCLDVSSDVALQVQLFAHILKFVDVTVTLYSGHFNNSPLFSSCTPGSAGSSGSRSAAPRKVTAAARAARRSPVSRTSGRRSRRRPEAPRERGPITCTQGERRDRRSLLARAQGLPAGRSGSRWPTATRGGTRSRPGPETTPTTPQRTPSTTTERRQAPCTEPPSSTPTSHCAETVSGTYPFANKRLPTLFPPKGMPMDGPPRAECPYLAFSGIAQLCY